jgi:hypothetical protein
MNLARVKSTLYDFGYVKSNTNSFMASIATSSPTTMPTSAHIRFYADGDGATGDDLNHDGDGAAYDDIDADSDGTAGDKVDDDGDEVDDVGDGAKLSLPSMRRRLWRRRDGVVTLVVMASLLSPMHMRLAVVVDDGNGVTGDNDDDYFDNAMDFAVVAMAFLPLSQWRHTMATAQRAMKSTTMAMARWRYRI